MLRSARIAWRDWSDYKGPIKTLRCASLRGTTDYSPGSWTQCIVCLCRRGDCAIDAFLVGCRPLRYAPRDQHGVPLNDAAKALLVKDREIIRKALAAWLVTKKALYQPTWLAQQREAGSYDEYCGKIAKPGFWLDQTAICALSSLFRVRNTSFLRFSVVFSADL